MPIFSGPFTSGGDENDTGRFSAQLARLLPPGAVWNFEAGSVLRKLLLALADELERVRARGRNLIDESDPRTASETIGDWEAALGLPDERVTEIPSTLEARRVAVTQKYAAQGGQSYDYFEALCEACGWPLVSIFRSSSLVLREGFRVGDRVYGAGYAYSMTLTLDPHGPGALPQADFERVIRHVTHSHITVMFVYL